jgi:hypothetical protein
MDSAGQESEDPTGDLFPARLIADGAAAANEDLERVSSRPFAVRIPMAAHVGQDG